MAVTGVLALVTAATADAGGALFISFIGAGLAALCYLYVRR